MVVGNSYTQTQHNMMENGQTTDNTDTVLKHGQMVPYIEDTIEMATKMVKEISHGLMEVPTEAIFLIITYTVAGYTNGQMEGFIMETG